MIRPMVYGRLFGCDGGNAGSEVTREAWNCVPLETSKSEGPGSR